MTNFEIRDLEVHTDNRGWLAEILRSEQAGGEIKGQFYVTVAKPGITKADHFHKRKTEWFCVVSGKALLTLKDLLSGAMSSVEMGENNMVVVKIPPNTAHSIKNIGNNDMMLLAYITEPFNPEDPDTFSSEL